MILENIIVSEISQEGQYCMIPLIYELSKIIKFIESKSAVMAARS